ncbi:MAG: hypothetical protein QG656_250, partial [Candidatus Hydrogenedentes bacterium]|nr:hypothetical protein [Candidatus Hydrogenedentota bacterium]
MTWMGSAWKWAAVLLAISVLCMGCGERNPKKCRVAVLNCDNVLEAVVDGFKDGMAKLGYVEGQSVEYLYDGPVMGEMEDIAARAKELAALRPDLVLAIGTPSALSFHEALGEREIPILFAVVDDPVGCGLIESAARPGGHITGVTYFGLQEAPRLKWMTVLAPTAKRLYCPCNA